MPRKKVTINIKQTKNSKLIRSLDNRCFPSDDPYPPEGAIWWLVTCGEFPVGFAGLKVLPNEPTVGFLCRAGVLYSYRGNKLQQKLLKVREKMAIKLGLKQLITYTSSVNYASISSLIKQGYKFYSPENPWAGKEGKDAFYFIKDLTIDNNRKEMV